MAFLPMAAFGVEAGASLLSIYEQSQVAEEQKQLLELQEGQEEIGAREQGIARAKKVREVMAAATAQAGARGFGAASSSFQRVQQSSFDAFQKDKDMEALNISLSKARLAAQKEIVEDKEWGGIFGTLSSLAGSIVKL